MKKEKQMKGVGVAVILLIALAGAFFLGKSQAEKETTIQLDTTYVEKFVTVEKIVYKRLPAILDTVLMTLHDTVEVPIQVASIDTVLDPYKDTLAVNYFFPPMNCFNLNYAPGPRPVQAMEIVKTVTIYQHDPWLADVLKIGAGIGVGFIAGKLAK